MIDDHERFLAALFGKERAGQQQPAPPQPGAPPQAAEVTAPPAQPTAPPQPAAPGPQVEGTPPTQPTEHEATVTPVDDLPAWRAKFGQQYGLPPALTGRLQGTTPAEVGEDARKLAASLGTGPGAAEQTLLRQNQGKNAALLRSIHPEARHTTGEGEQ